MEQAIENLKLLHDGLKAESSTMPRISEKTRKVKLGITNLETAILYLEAAQNEQ